MCVCVFLRVLRMYVWVHVCVCVHVWVGISHEFVLGACCENIFELIYHLHHLHTHTCAHTSSLLSVTYH